MSAVHPLLVPPEALEPTGADAPPGPRKPWLWTATGVALTSLIAVTVSVSAGVAFVIAPVIVPCTALVAYGFWHAGRRITRLRDMLLYCLVGGALTGAVNAWLTLGVWSMFGGGYFLRNIQPDALKLAGVIGAVAGIAYGCAYLLPMLSRLRARALLRSEGVDRSLVSYGIWGVIVLPLGFTLIVGHPEATNDVLVPILATSFVLHLSMLLLGTVRWARRRAWLARVLKGKVPGWLVCDSQRFHAAELEALQIFSCPLFARPSPNQLRVLAWGDGSDAYRTTPLTPKYFVR